MDLCGPKFLGQAMLNGEGMWQASGVCNLVGNNIFTFPEAVGRCRQSD